MQLNYTCPLCGKVLKLPNSRHTALHDITQLEWHKLRIEKQTGRELQEVLEDLYITQRLGTPEVSARLAVTFRTLKNLLQLVGLDTRSKSEGVKASWEKDDGTRSEIASKTFRRINERHDITGERNPAKRPAIRAKISAAKKAENPGLVPMLEANRELRLANPSDLEVVMLEALVTAGVHPEREYRVGRYFIDFALPAVKVGIEADGSGWHERKPAHDVRRDKWLAEQGWRIFRYSSGEIKRIGVTACVEDLIANLNILGIDPTTKG